MRKRKYGRTLVLSAVLIISLLLPVSADELSEQQQQLQDIDRQIQQQQAGLDRTKQQEKTVTGQILNLQKNIQTTENELNAISERLSFLENNIQQQEKAVKVLENDLAKQTEILGERLTFAYEQGDSTFLEVLLDASDLKDFITRYDWLSSIFEQDRDLIADINTKKTELEAKKQQIQADIAELEQARIQQEEKKALLAAQKDDKEGNLSQIKDDKAKYEQALAELEETSLQLERMIRGAQSGGNPAFSGTGTLMWPSASSTTITSPFGMRFHPILKQYKLHTGIDIGASNGSNILAADSGTVISAGWMGGYGQATIIDHGDGVSTLYAHQSQILVKNGQQVGKGEVIGKVGSTGWSTGPHLHFEVRINGTPDDPTKYVRG